MSILLYSNLATCCHNAADNTTCVSVPQMRRQYEPDTWAGVFERSNTVCTAELSLLSSIKAQAPELHIYQKISKKYKKIHIFA